MTVKDPIKDLMDEIAAEGDESGTNDQVVEEEVEAAPKKLNAKKASVPRVPASDEDEEADEDEETDDKATDRKKAAAKGKKEEEEDDEEKAEEKPRKPRSRFVPITRLNEVEARRRAAERERDELSAQLAEALKAAKDGKTPLTKEERETITNGIRQQERVRMRAETMVNVGYEEFGQKEFDAASSVLSDLGAPDDMILLALEACGSSSAAARALYNLAQEDAEKVEELFKLSPIRLAARLAQYTDPPRRGRTKAAGKKRGEEPEDELEEDEDAEQDEDDEEEPLQTRRAAGKPVRKVSRAPEPARLVRGTRKVEADMPSDDDSEDEFTAKFDRLMNKGRAVA